MFTEAASNIASNFAPAVPTLGILQAFLTSAAQVVGKDFVRNSEDVIGHYARSCSGTSRRALAVIQPSSTEEVQQIVLLAGKYLVKLYPISRGCNWGLGDACPTTDNQVILDLRRMNRITTADGQLGAFTVEPGVTQQQMFEYLQDNNLPFWYDASGAGPDASLLGNLMERGYGHTPLGERFQNTCNYEVVLADGEVFRTGFGDVENCKVKHLFKPGIGPSLDGLFTQSNLGIVTEATFWMMPIPEYFEAYAFQLDSDQQLEDCIDALQPLRANGTIASALHIGNDYRVLSSRTQFPYDRASGDAALPPEIKADLMRQHGVAAWSGLGAYYGTRIGVRAFRSQLRKTLKGITKPIFLSDRKLRLAKTVLQYAPQWQIFRSLQLKLESAGHVISLLKGEPVAQHLSGAAWRSGTQWRKTDPSPIDRGDGILWLTPLLPCKSREVRELNTILTETITTNGFEPLLTYVMINPRTMVCPITICFEQTDEGREKAMRCLSELRERCETRGFNSYRSASYIGSRSYPTSERIKRSLDPNQLLATGRYGL